MVASRRLDTIRAKGEGARMLLDMIVEGIYPIASPR